MTVTMATVQGSGSHQDSYQFRLLLHCGPAAAGKIDRAARGVIEMRDG